MKLALKVVKVDSKKSSCYLRSKSLKLTVVRVARKYAQLLCSTLYSVRQQNWCKITAIQAARRMLMKLSRTRRQLAELLFAKIYWETETLRVWMCVCMFVSLSDKTRNSRSQSYKTLISSFFRFSLLSLAISKYRQYFLMLQTLKLNNKQQKKSSFYEEKKFGRIDSRTKKKFAIPKPTFPHTRVWEAKKRGSLEQRMEQWCLTFQPKA